MDGLLDLKRRIKSISSTRQVTKAMEAVSASKMRKSTERAVSARSFAEQIRSFGKRVKGAELHHPLLNVREVKSALGILITSDRGLCGGLNSGVARAFTVKCSEYAASGVGVRVIGIGKKGNILLKRSGISPDVAYEGFSDPANSKQLHSIATYIIEEYTAERIDEVFVGYTHFQSSMRQTPELRQILPITREDLAQSGRSGMSEDESFRASHIVSDRLLEPTPEHVLQALLPRLIHVELYQVLLESLASEHSARMMAMHNATDSASSMIDELTLTYNQARQAAITQEIAEIVAGRLALSN